MNSGICTYGTMDTVDQRKEATRAGDNKWPWILSRLAGKRMRGSENSGRTWILNGRRGLTGGICVLR